MPSPITPAPMIATRGFLPTGLECGVWSVRRGSLRWYDPDRFDGFDLSRAPSLYWKKDTAPLADGVMMGVLRPLGKSRTLPPMPQQACADKADDRNHGDSDERRHAEAKMAKGVTVIDRSDRLPGRVNSARTIGRASRFWPTYRIPTGAEEAAPCP
jgi:hypothetical protein